MNDGLILREEDHPHGDLAAEYLVDAKKYVNPWLLWEVEDPNRSGRWLQCLIPPTWFSSLNYRRKPETIGINGIDVPKPRIAGLFFGQSYFTPNLVTGAAKADIWTGSKQDIIFLRNGLVHDTYEAASLHAQALLSFKELLDNALDGED